MLVKLMEVKCSRYEICKLKHQFCYSKVCIQLWTKTFCDHDIYYGKSQYFFRQSNVIDSIKSNWFHGKIYDGGAPAADCILYEIFRENKIQRELKEIRKIVNLTEIYVIKLEFGHEKAIYSNSYKLLLVAFF